MDLPIDVISPPGEMTFTSENMHGFLPSDMHVFFASCLTILIVYATGCAGLQNIKLDADRERIRVRSYIFRLSGRCSYTPACHTP